MGGNSMPNINGFGIGQENSNIKNILSQVLPNHKRSLNKLNHRAHIKTFSQASVKQLFVSASSPTNFRH